MVRPKGDQNNIKTMSKVKVSDKKHCANCAIDRSINLVGVCSECYTKYLTGQVVKIKDTMDKDDWSCGCGLHDYGGAHSEFYCQVHNKDESPMK